MEKILRRWIQEKRSLGLWNRTSADLAQRWGRIFLRYLTSYCVTSLTQITREHLQLYRKQRIFPLSLNSQYQEYKFLFSFFGWCQKEKLLLSSPVAGWKYPKLKKLETPIFSLEDIEVIFNAIDTSSPAGIRDRTIVELLYATAIRKSEIIALDLDSVDLATSYLQVMGKGNRQRVVPIISPARAWLIRYLEESRNKLLKNSGCQALFLSLWGGRLHSSTLFRLFEQLKETTGIIRITPHMFRHSCATHLMEFGVELPYIQKFLGHSCIKNTERYLHISASEVEKHYESAHPRDKWQ